MPNACLKEEVSTSTVQASNYTFQGSIIVPVADVPSSEDSFSFTPLC